MSDSLTNNMESALASGRKDAKDCSSKAKEKADYYKCFNEFDKEYSEWMHLRPRDGEKRPAKALRMCKQVYCEPKESKDCLKTCNGMVGGVLTRAARAKLAKSPTPAKPTKPAKSSYGSYSDSGSDTSLENSAVSSTPPKENKTAACIRKVANFSVMKPAFQLDNKAFNPELMQITIDEASPKLSELFKKIAELDAKDMRKEGKVYKHFIYTDVLASNFGAKLIAGAFVANGFTPAFNESMNLKDDRALRATKGDNFGILMSKTIYGKSIPTKNRKAMAAKYNERPENSHGDLMRFIILDSGFREGIDLFDVKYVHLFEPLLVRADEKQAIGRGTRFCGQKGLNFHPTYGWPLYVFRYDVEFDEKIEGADTMFELYSKYSDIDLRRLVFAAELEDTVIDATVDKLLTKEVHTFKINQPPPVLAESAVHAGGGLREIQSEVEKLYGKFKYEHVKMENKCNEKPGPTVTFSPTQEFVRHYFTPKSERKGILFHHSLGSGKTCSAIATATSSFEKEGYTIVWVTRHTLKSDIWKNMFRQICHVGFIEQGKTFPEKIGAPMKQLSNQWIEPMSYKQFSNMLLKENRFYKTIVDKNGEADPLRKTLLIIDEAHKLYTKTGPAAERPRMDIFEKMIQDSYKKSGKDSVRVLLMTATPYTDDPMEMMKLMNLLREEKLDTNFDMFSKKYLDKHGHFTRSGKELFQDEISGYISYINRSQDARNFAHPIIQPVYVKMSYSDGREPTKELDERVKELIAMGKDTRAIIREEKAACKDVTKEARSTCNEEHKGKLEKLKEAFKKKKEECKGKGRKDCVAEVKSKYEGMIEAMKTDKKGSLARCINKKISKSCSGLAKAQEELEKYKEEKESIRSRIREVMGENKDLTADAKELRFKLKTMRQEKASIAYEKKELRPKLKGNPEVIKKIQALNNRLKEMAKPYAELKANIVNNNNKKKLNRIKIFRAVLPDSAMQTALRNKCGV